MKGKKLNCLESQVNTKQTTPHLASASPSSSLASSASLTTATTTRASASDRQGCSRPT